MFKNLGSLTSMVYLNRKTIKSKRNCNFKSKLEKLINYT